MSAENPSSNVSPANEQDKLKTAEYRAVEKAAIDGFFDDISSSSDDDSSDDDSSGGFFDDISSSSEDETTDDDSSEDEETIDARIELLDDEIAKTFKDLADEWSTWVRSQPRSNDDGEVVM